MYTSIILPVVLYECKTWSLTRKEERRLRVSVNRVLRMDKVTGEWRKLHSEKRNDLYSPNIIRLSNQEECDGRDMWHMWERERNACRVLVGKPERKRPLGRPRRRWEDNVKIDLTEAGWGMDWIDMAHDRNRWQSLVNAVMNLRAP